MTPSTSAGSGTITADPLIVLSSPWVVTPPPRIVPSLDVAASGGLEAKGLREELVGAQTRFEVVRDGHDHELGGSVCSRERREPLAHLLGGARERAPLRVVDDGQLLLRVRVRFRLLDGWECAGASRVEPRDPQRPALREP